MDDAVAKEDQTEAEEARKILAQEISSLEEKAESEKDKIRNPKFNHPESLSLIWNLQI